MKETLHVLGILSLPSNLPLKCTLPLKWTWDGDRDGYHVTVTELLYVVT